jgi:hypothetical protein
MCEVAENVIELTIPITRINSFPAIRSLPRGQDNADPIESNQRMFGLVSVVR